MATTVAKSALHTRYVAAMVLAGVGDSLGYNSGIWEFNQDGPQIHSQVKAIGGVSKLKNKLPNFKVSDDTVMHLATASALVNESSQSNNEELFNNLAEEYISCMDDMNGRAPGNTCMASCHKLQIMRSSPEGAKAYRIPFNPRGGGCGAAMRAMCIGLRYPKASELDQLITVSVESGRMTHNSPTGYLGALVSALFTSYALQDKPVISWGAELVNTVLPHTKEIITKIGVDVEMNLSHWSYFERAWVSYLTLRKIKDGTSEPVFPEVYGVKERDKYYAEISYSGWGGASGHDSVIIAYDAMLGSKGDWAELCSRATFHGGDNDSTGTIASCWYGAKYGFDGVPGCNHEEVEYRSKMVQFADQLYSLSQDQ